MKVSIDRRTEKLLNRLSRPEKARIARVVGLFSEKGFLLSEIYLKKLTRSIWELRAGNIRLLFGVVEAEAIIVNVFLKKTAKTPPREIELASKRLMEYL